MSREFRATAALWMSCFGRLVNLYPLVSQPAVTTRMALLGRDESNRSVTMLVVVPLNEDADPNPLSPIRSNRDRHNLITNKNQRH